MQSDDQFKCALAESDLHVRKLVELIQQNIQLPSNICNFRIRAAELVVRPSYKQRKLYADKGDIKVSWTDQTSQTSQRRRATLEVKQRKSQTFDKLANCRYPTVLVDTLTSFDRIRKRNDVLAYILTSKNHACIFAVAMQDLVDNMVVNHRNFGWPTASKCVELAKHQFVEGLDQVCSMLVQQMINYQTCNAQTLVCAAAWPTCGAAQNNSC